MEYPEEIESFEIVGTLGWELQTRVLIGVGESLLLLVESIRIQNDILITLVETLNRYGFGVMFILASFGVLYALWRKK